MKDIIFKIENGVGVIKLNRPDKLNSFNLNMAEEFLDALNKCNTDESIRAVLLTGEGRAFCAGQDLAAAIGENAPELAEIIEKQYNPIIKAIREIPKPVVCAVNGVAAGAGANIAFACDITFSSTEATFIQSFTNIGLIPDSAGTYFIPRIIGLQRATAIMMTGDKLSAKEANEWGLVYKLFPPETLLENSILLVEKLAKMPTKGIGLTKKALNESFNNDLNEQLELEKKLQQEAGNSYDYNEGVNAFLEKRKPNFTGK